MKDASAPRTYSFSYELNGLVPEKKDDGTIALLDKDGNAVFELGRLFAVDSAGAYTDELSYTIESREKGTAVISFTVPEDYINDPERVFPILVDPTTTNITGTSKTKDAYVSSNHTGTNYGSSAYLRTGKDSNYEKRRTYIRFTIPSAFQYIITAKLRIKQQAGTTPNITAYRVTGSWSDSSITWSNRPGFSSSDHSDTAGAGANNWYSMEVSEIVRDWQRGRKTNYGFMLKDANETDGHWATFYSSDCDTEAYKPVLRIVHVALSYDAYLTAYRELDITGSPKPRADYFATVSHYVTTIRNGAVGTLFYPDTDYPNLTKEQMLSIIQSTWFFFVHSHGSQNSIGLGNYLLNSVYLSDKDLSNQRLAVLLCCDCGDDGYTPSNVTNNTPVNMVERMVIQGVETVIGFQGITYEFECNLFAELLAAYTIAGEIDENTTVEPMSIEDAVEEMYILPNATDPSHQNINRLLGLKVIGGNTQQKLDW